MNSDAIAASLSSYFFLSPYPSIRSHFYFRRYVPFMAPVCFSSLCFPVFCTFFGIEHEVFLLPHTTVPKVLLSSIKNVASVRKKRPIVCMFLK